ncbi:MAG TPA: RIP metalloprotease RseP [Rhizomicrobium sp.]|jgi:regulator of sigma E protease|nr:RIP metalloprotease RseP [Rhizomicrobium sp.]
MTAVHDLFQWAPLGLPAYVFLITVVVFFHELGHFAVARWCGVKVETFSIGFGPEIVGWFDRKGTRWKISWIPFGGYVKFFGDADAASTPDRELVSRLTEEEKRVSFLHKPVYQRAMVVAAGPIANFILAVVIFAGFLFAFGHVSMPPIVGSVAPHSAAEAAGIKKGDIIRSINGEQIKEFDRLPEIVSLSAGQTLTLELERQGKVFTVHAMPRLMQVKDPVQGDAKVVALGVRSDPKAKLTVVKYGPLEAIGQGVSRVWLIVHGTLTTIWQMVAGQADMSQLRGPVGMAGMAQKVAALSFWYLVQLAAVISVSIGLINLFPIPMLDGGHLLYYAFEAVLGRPLGERAQDVGYRLGLAAVLGLVILVTWNDLVRLNLF